MQYGLKCVPITKNDSAESLTLVYGVVYKGLAKLGKSVAKTLFHVVFPRVPGPGRLNEKT